MTDTPTTTRAQPVDPARLVRFKDFRLILDLSQEQLATRAGLRREKVCKVEKGRDKASTRATFAALARGFGCSVEDLEDVLSGRVEAGLMVKRMRRRAAAAGEGVAK